MESSKVELGSRRVDFSPSPVGLNFGLEDLGFTAQNAEQQAPDYDYTPTSIAAEAPSSSDDNNKKREGKGRRAFTTTQNERARVPRTYLIRTSKASHPSRCTSANANECLKFVQKKQSSLCPELIGDFYRLMFNRNDHYIRGTDWSQMNQRCVLRSASTMYLFFRVSPHDLHELYNSSMP